MENLNPEVNHILEKRFDLKYENDLYGNKIKDITKETIFELIRDIKDPEHPYSLEQLNVVNLNDIEIFNINENNIKKEIICKKGIPFKYIKIRFTPTVPHCSMCGIIGLSIIFQIKKFIKNTHIQIKIKEGTHSNEALYNKQLNDHDRVYAAFENEDLMELINECLPNK